MGTSATREFDMTRRICETQNCCRSGVGCLTHVPCRSGGIGRRAWFRSMYSQGCGGSSPFFGTSSFKINDLPPWCPSWCPQNHSFGVHLGVHFAALVCASSEKDTQSRSCRDRWTTLGPEHPSTSSRRSEQVRAGGS